MPRSRTGRSTVSTSPSLAPPLLLSFWYGLFSDADFDKRIGLLAIGALSSGTCTIGLIIWFRLIWGQFEPDDDGITASMPLRAPVRIAWQDVVEVQMFGIPYKDGAALTDSGGNKVVLPLGLMSSPDGLVVAIKPTIERIRTAELAEMTHTIRTFKRDFQTGGTVFMVGVAALLFFDAYVASMDETGRMPPSAWPAALGFLLLLLAVYGANWRLHLGPSEIWTTSVFGGKRVRYDDVTSARRRFAAIGKHGSVKVELLELQASTGSFVVASTLNDFDLIRDAILTRIRVALKEEVAAST